MGAASLPSLRAENSCPKFGARAGRSRPICLDSLPEDNGLVSFSRGCVHVARTVSAMGDAAASWSAESTTCGSGIGTVQYADVPAAVVPGAMQVAYLAASTTSAVSTASARVGPKEASRHAARAAIRNDAAPKLKGSASETMSPILRLKVIRSSYAATGLNVRTEAKEESSGGCVVPAGRKLSITATVIKRIPMRVIPGQRFLWLTQQLLHSGRLT